MFKYSHYLATIFFPITVALCTSCETTEELDDLSEEQIDIGNAQLTTGVDRVTSLNLFGAGDQLAAVGVAVANDGSEWTVPADIRYKDTSIPWAGDLYNPYGGQNENVAQALANFPEDKVVVIDEDGELITAYVLADNYFELYINGVGVAKDPIPYTGLNSTIVKFRVARPFNVAVQLVDWEENLGEGTEQSYTEYHAGLGMFVATFRDSSNTNILVSDESWKAQTFYIAPIANLGCISLEGNDRLSEACPVPSEEVATENLALHWELPAEWESSDFDDSNWPYAKTVENSRAVLTDELAYNRFTDIFSTSSFIWSSNPFLDNEVLMRVTVE